MSEEPTPTLSTQLREHLGKQVILHGHVLGLRRLGNIAFIQLRDRTGTAQIVVESPSLLQSIESLSLESAIECTGLVVQNNQQVEVQLRELTVLSSGHSLPPVEIGKQKKMESLSLNSMLEYRPLTLRSPWVRAIFKIEAAICSFFREFLEKEGFTEIHSPKIVATGTEGGANLFALEYFGKQAYLAQSPQFYKQAMVGVFERVYEIGPVYRAEEHDTSRHLNEYISLDLEIGFIKSEKDLIALKTRLIHHILERLSQECLAEFALFGLTIPAPSTIPSLTYEEACQLLQSKLGWKSESPLAMPDIDPEGERLLYQHVLKEYNSEFVFLTAYPQEVRPFYAMPLEGTPYTRSFDLLFRGLEITTGGQRIHNYEMLVENMKLRGLNPETFTDYLQCFNYGMPPHGGMATGLERLAKQLLNLPNVKLASLFPRDRNRLGP